ncbi:Mitochondrial inner membrane protease atp23 [Stygiomarasmius scandens]|uniref:Mitochondrial inner membrane protease ATP23 n=1 Tax=Marasmiellus scandens TaxID=2682957 RepID=A0ABR1JL32_9AGAR
MSDSSTSSSSSGSNGSDPNSSSSTPSAFERWRKKVMFVTGIGVTHEERMQDLQQLQNRRCEQMKKELMDTSPLVTFLLRHLRLSGCQVPESNIFCGTCDPQAVVGGGSVAHAGGFIPEHGAIKLCGGMFFNKKHVETTIAHELIHMYDQCKFKVDWKNLRHHACSEIRANSLSGDCRYTRELRRGFVAFSKQHQACVRRRAIVSVTANPACPDEATAERVVNEVWESCFSDTRPFDEIY